jgi:2'-5' RNA ligase
MIRLFVGLALPDDIAGRLAVMAAGIPGARWVERRNLHLTLRFIGEVEEGVAQEIHECLGEIRAAGFDLAITGFGTFGRSKLNALWAAVEKNSEIVHLQAKVDAALVRAGIAPEGRKFVPHVTLARLKDPPVARVQEFIAGNSPFRAEFSVENFILFRSRLGRGGAEYEAVGEYPLV